MQHEEVQQQQHEQVPTSNGDTEHQQPNTSAKQKLDKRQKQKEKKQKNKLHKQQRRCECVCAYAHAFYTIACIPRAHVHTQTHNVRASFSAGKNSCSQQHPTKSSSR